MPITLDGTGSITGLTTTGISAVQQLPAGSVIQVVNATTSTQVSNSTTTYADTGLTATITPKFSTSKILILVSQNGCYKTGATGQNCIDLKLVRNTSTLVSQFTGAGLYTNSAMELVGTFSVCALDSPATTSATTYNTQFASRNNTNGVYVQYASVSQSTITLMEIAQ